MQKPPELVEYKTCTKFINYANLALANKTVENLQTKEHTRDACIVWKDDVEGEREWFPIASQAYPVL